jgi:glyoxylase-like metal-dependent hydrolase (beta-lactamase superfamily II)
VGVSGLAAFAMAQGRGQAPPAAPFMVHQLKPNVYWIEGGGGNSGVIVGDKGVIVIDAKTSAAGGKELLEDIAKITPKPVTTVILTHSDGDHVNGLASFPAGVKVIAHENNKKEQEKALAAGGRGAPPADHLPSQVVSKNKESLKIEGVKLELHHWAPAHTSGDLVIYLPSEKIVFTGDVIAGGKAADPLIHLEKDGSSEGWITTVKGIAAINADTFIEGHGDTLTKADIQKRLTDTEAKRAKIKDLVAQGKSLDDIRTAVGDPPPAQAAEDRRPRS